MSTPLSAEIRAFISAEIARQRGAIDKIITEVGKKADAAVVTASAAKKATDHGHMQLMSVKSSAQEVARVEVERALAVINNEIVPKVENMVQFVRYQTEDGNLAIDEYRRGVEHQHAPRNTSDPRAITPFVRTLWGDDH